MIKDVFKAVLIYDDTIKDDTFFFIFNERTSLQTRSKKKNTYVDDLNVVLFLRSLSDHYTQSKPYKTVTPLSLQSAVTQIQQW